MHGTKFARTMRGLGSNGSYGGYVDVVPAISLASVIKMSLFGLNRRLRGAIAGNLLMHEKTSPRPSQLYRNGSAGRDLMRKTPGSSMSTSKRTSSTTLLPEGISEEDSWREEPDLPDGVLFCAVAVSCLDAASPPASWRPRRMTRRSCGQQPGR